MPDSEGLTPPGVNVVERGISDLWDIIQAARESGNIEMMMAQLERWKSRTTDDIRTHISPQEAEAFSRLSIRPNWVTMEPIDGPVERHDAFLSALLADLRARPRSRPVKAARKPRPGYSPPRRSLNSWLERESKVRGKFWTVVATLVGLILTALALL